MTSAAMESGFFYLAGSGISPLFLFSSKLAKSMAAAIVLFAGLFIVIAPCEAKAGVSVKRYATRNVFNDLIYSLFYQGGIYILLIYTPFFDLVRGRLSLFDLHLVDRMPAYLSLPLYFLAMDFYGYWIHRLQHTRLFWPFHSVHHSQTQLSFFTLFRFHLLEQFWTGAIVIIPVLFLGVQPKTWLPLQFLHNLLTALPHAELNWRLGPLYRVLNGPVFHSFHHSPDPKYFNKNFGMFFSFWDFLFGTAVDAPDRCRIYGVAGLDMPETISRQFVTPFRMLYRQSFATPNPEQHAVPRAPSA